MYIVLEIQGASVIASTYEDGADAENKYHTILAYAAKSQVPVHAAAMLNENGALIKHEYYVHATEEPQEVEE